MAKFGGSLRLVWKAKITSSKKVQKGEIIRILTTENIQIVRYKLENPQMISVLYRTCIFSNL